jgi:hypothetical protein
MQAWNAFREDQGNAEALDILNRLNPANNGAPKIALFGMSLSGAFSNGAQDPNPNPDSILFFYQVGRWS